MQVIFEFNGFSFGITQSETLFSHPGTEQYNLLNLNAAEKPSEKTKRPQLKWLLTCSSRPTKLS